MRRRWVPIWALAMLAMVVASCSDRPAADDVEPAPTAAESTPEPARPPTTTTAPASVPPPPVASRPKTAGTIAPTAPADAGDGSTGIVEHGGVSFVLPPGWERTGQVIATEFATGADCVAGTIVDFEPPTDPAAGGEAAFRLQSTVQVCARPSEDRTLDEFIDVTYGGRAAFEPVRLGGLDGYRSVTGLDSLSFVQTDRDRYQVVTSVAAEAELEPVRLAEVAELVSSLAFA